MNLQDTSVSANHIRARDCPAALHHLHTTTQSSHLHFHSVLTQADTSTSIPGNDIGSRLTIKTGKQIPSVERFAAGVSTLLDERGAISMCDLLVAVPGNMLSLAPVAVGID